MVNDHLLKTKNEFKNLKKHEIRDIFTKMNFIRHDFSMIWLLYDDFKNLERRTASDQILRDKAFNIAKNPKYDGHQGGLTSIVYKFFL